MTPKPGGLARVAIMNFINASSSDDHEWVEKSLPDAINESMRVRFEFIRQDENKVRASANLFKPQHGEYSIQEGESIATTSQSDILIYGNFRISEDKKQILMRAIIYNAAGKKVIGTVEESSNLNARIFKAIDQMAAEIVEKIYTYAIQAERAAGKNRELKILVLVPSYTTPDEEAQAIQELQALKNELSNSYSGKYITIFEFFEEYQVTPREREKALDFAKARDRESIIRWLDGFGIKDVFVVMVNGNRVNIIPVHNSKPAAQVTYPVAATPEEKKTSITQAVRRMESGGEKVELKTDTLKSESVRHMSWGAMPLFAVPLGFTRTGFGFAGGVQTYLDFQNLFMEKLHLGFGAHYARYFRSDDRVVSLDSFSISGYAAYDLLTVYRIRFLPVIGGGMDFGIFQGSISSGNYRVPSAYMGFRALYPLRANLSLTTQTLGMLQFDSSVNTIFMMAMGVEWQFR